jgi:hypothetical protein
MTAPSTEDILLSTSRYYLKLHDRIQRFCWVLLIGLALEGQDCSTAEDGGVRADQGDNN